MYLPKNSVSTVPVRDHRQFTENATFQASSSDIVYVVNLDGSDCVFFPDEVV